MPLIECEIRSFIDESRYQELLDWFTKEAEFLGEQNEVTYYLDAPQDIRIQQNDSYAKVWLKKGKLHDDAREEMEIRFAREDFEKMGKVFSEIGFCPSIKWSRKRNEFNWEGCHVCVDWTKGYGYILELERLVPAEEQVSAVADLKSKLQELGITETPKEVFEQAFREYKENWRSLVENPRGSEAGTLV